MIKRLSIIKESDTKSEILPEISNSGGHLTQKLLRKISLFVTNEHSQTPLMEITLCAHREVAGEERGNDFAGARLQDFWQVWSKNHAHPRVVS